MKKRFLLLFLTVFTYSLSTHAQETGEKRLGAWYMYFGTNKISEDFSIHTEAQFRFYEVADNFNQLLLRTGLNYHFSPNAIATFGYGFISTDGTFEDFPSEENSTEHRIYEQFILKNSIEKLKFEHRYRLEQRFISYLDENDTQHRARYRLQLTYPLSEKWFVNVYDEVFLNLQDEVFGQNRLYGALGYKVNSKLSLQAGYLKNHFPNGKFDRLQLAVFFNPDFTKS
ncbi:DUF2490 domain-containing protein [Galbibacter sp. EGI 63066]|uniref:DUF2490 domain-containing protein n=1 Tax=Galbibacter sp. EGI 63066 TaxID=2993559 RepID=UPI002248E9C5|nr:DUF2490 domain-containing protein [Galbibacter sp. EGI 63066]MCX2679133.1 DUF2490 domain-containing protein [Galbibacter sp. EGI 63066]